MRQNEQVPDLGQNSSRIGSNDWGQNLRQTTSEPELPQMKKIKIIKKIVVEKDSDQRSLQTVVKDKSLPTTPKPTLKAIKLKK